MFEIKFKVGIPPQPFLVKRVDLRRYLPFKEEDVFLVDIFNDFRFRKETSRLSEGNYDFGEAGFDYYLKNNEKWSVRCNVRVDFTNHGGSPPHVNFYGWLIDPIERRQEIELPKNMHFLPSEKPVYLGISINKPFVQTKFHGELIEASGTYTMGTLAHSSIELLKTLPKR